MNKWIKSLFSLSNKIAVVTGASQGIGRQVAITMGEAGAHVICLARTELKIQEVSKEINDKGGSSIAKCCDISDSNSYIKTIKTILDDYNTIDILVNNAGITKDSLVLRMNENQWNEVIQTNLTGSFYGIKAVLKSMIKNRFGRIINITSIVGLTGNAGQANYAASKSGIIGMTQSIAKEVGSRGITVNCIAPGWINTEMTTELPENSKKDLLDRIPIKKIGKPEDIAYTALFLASNEASYITGQTITVDGGRVIN